MDSKKKWLVFYTKSRQERKVDEFLRQRGYTTFLPLQKVVRQWSDRKKKIEIPLFSSYIFVNDAEHKIPDILQAPGLAWNIRQNGKPAVLPDQQLDLIRRFLDTGFTIETKALNTASFQTGERAKIIDGPLKGVEGTVLSIDDGHVFTVVIEGIDQVLRAQIPAFLLKKL